MALERVVQQHVALAQALEDGPRTRDLPVGPARLPAREVQAAAVGLVDELAQAHQVDRPVHLVQRHLGQRKLLEQKAVQLRRAGADDLQPDRQAIVSRGQAAAHGLAQVHDIVGLDVQVGVAGDAELRKRHHLAPGKQLAQVGAHDAGEQHETLLPRAQFVGQADHARQHARHLDDGDLVVAAEGVAPAQPGDEVQRLVGHLRERVAGVQAHRHQQRPHLGLEEALHPFALRDIALGVVEHDDAGLLQRRHQHVVEQRVLFVDEFVRGVGHRNQVLARDARARLPRGFDDVGHAHLEEFVEVAADDGDVAQPLEQRHVVAPGLGQHAAIELQDGALAVEQRQGARLGRRAGSSGNGTRHQGP